MRDERNDAMENDKKERQQERNQRNDAMENDKKERQQERQ